MRHSEWLQKASGEASPREIDKVTGISFRTIHDQAKREHITAENIIKIAEGYGHNPVTALIDTGYLEAKWATATDPIAALQAVSEEALADEVLRRMKHGLETDNLTTPVDELEARRSKTIPNSDLKAVPNDPEDVPHVADESPDEDALRAQEEGGDWSDPDHMS
ncbi:hypothetical protein [Corynebacterium lubricantis]|uniref:hypothetical protein n=1 Tax=Corynebacterium lubricantis TaxID=541095 RepID=UPI00036CA50B|nr:hypothetical protein [Corynebacterium lubricantis]